MKLNKFNKKLKEEFNDTLNPIELKDDQKEHKHVFRIKPKYIILSILSIFVIFTIVNHIYVSIYNDNLDKKYEEQLKNRKEINYDSIETNVSRYESKESLSNALVYTDVVLRGNKKTSILQAIFNVFPSGCTSSNKSDYRIYEPSSGDSTDRTWYTSPDSSDSKNSYKTNVVEEGIDEADAAKCDGIYIYTLSLYNFKIFDLEGNEITSLNNSNNYVKMYIYNDNVILTDNYSVYSIYKFDGTKLELIDSINSNIIDSRLYNGSLYVIGYNYFSYLETDKLDYNNCYYDGSIDPSRSVSLYKYNLETNELSSATLVTGKQFIVYMSENYIYITSRSIYDYSVNYYSHYYDATTFFIFDLDLNGYAAFKERGYANDKYSFSEYNGYFRFVLTDIMYDVYNSVYIYNLETKKYEGSLLHQIGLQYENIKSVRFDGDYLYVCTYRRTDPLYKIDLSDPKDIKILSELHVDGYSDYLHKFIINDKTYVLGVGYNADNYSKITIYEDGDELKQIGNSAIIMSKRYSSYVPYVEEETLVIDDINLIDSLNGNAIGYFFFNDGDKFYFGSQVSSTSYALFEIDVTSESPISLKETVIAKNFGYTHDKNSYKKITFLRCFLVNSKLYFVGDDNIVIKDF